MPEVRRRQDVRRRDGAGLTLLGVAIIAGASLLDASPLPANLRLQSDQNRGMGVITGVVIDAATKTPMAGAVVYLGRDGSGIVGQQSRQLTDSKGRFAFTDLPAGDRYSITTSRSGYFDGGFSTQERWGARDGLLVLADGQWLRDLRVQMFRPAAIGGVVIDERGEPVAGVYVRLIALISVAGRDRLAASGATTTDDRGTYRVGGLPPGRYIVSVPSVQAAVPASTTAAHIAGLTEDRIAATQRTTGRAVPVPVEQAIDLDVGARLMVGRYPVPPPPSDGQVFAYPTMFHPGVSAFAQATPIEVSFGDERTGVDVPLRAERASAIAGRIDGPADAYENLTLRLVPSGMEDLGLGSEAATALVASDGIFVFAGVPAGSYAIEAPTWYSQYSYGPSMSAGSVLRLSGPSLGRPPGSMSMSTSSGTIAFGPAGLSYSRTTLDGQRTRWSRVPVTVEGRSVTNVVVPLRESGSLTGRIELDADPGQPQPELGGLSILADPADGSPRLGRPSASIGRGVADPAFELRGMLDGAYLLRVSGAVWILKSVTHQGRDVTHVPIDFAATPRVDGVVVTLTNRKGTIGGSVRDSQGAAGAARVVMFPADPARWTSYGLLPPGFQHTVTSSAGTYRLTNVPGGEYFLMAIPLDRTDWHEPDFFRKASTSAARVRLDWGGSLTQELSLMAK